MPLLYILLGGIVLIALYAIGVYNSLTTLKVRIKASVQEIGNQLKRQANLIPNLVESVKGYMDHEQEAFKKITEARKQINTAVKGNDPQKMVEASDALSNALGSIRLVVEDTPELKADQPTQKLMDELRDTADKVMYARRTLIDLTADYNTKLQVFPSNIVANIFGFQPEKGLQTAMEGAHISVSEEETKAPKVEL